MKLRVIYLLLISIFLLSGCDRNISLSDSTKDKTPPTLTCSTLMSYYVGDPEPSHNELCSAYDSGGDVTLTSTSSANMNFSGEYYIVVTGIDPSGNTASEVITIIVSKVILNNITMSDYDYYLGLTYDAQKNDDKSSYEKIIFEFKELSGYEYVFNMIVRIEYTSYDSNTETSSSNSINIYFSQLNLLSGKTHNFSSSNDVISIDSVEVTSISGAVYNE